MLQRAVANPFYVLGLTPAARWADVVLRHRTLREALAASESLGFETPLGARRLDADLLDRALEALQDADQRLIHELRYVPVQSRRAELRVVTEAGQ